MMTIGTGIGSGVIMNGEVMYGKHFQAGSLGGHFVVDYKGRLCSCGNKGCVEALSSSFFLHKIIKDHACLSPSFKMSSQNYDFKEIFQLAEQGNRDALLVRNECIEIWGAAVINFIHAYDPEVVILGGGIMNSHKVIESYTICANSSIISSLFKYIKSSLSYFTKNDLTISVAFLIDIPKFLPFDS